MYSGCGGGYLIVASEDPPPGAARISVRVVTADAAASQPGRSPGGPGRPPSWRRAWTTSVPTTCASCRRRPGSGRSTCVSRRTPWSSQITGSPPVFPAAERLFLAESLRWVDGSRHRRAARGRRVARAGRDAGRHAGGPGGGRGSCRLGRRSCRGRAATTRWPAAARAGFPIADPPCSPPRPASRRRHRLLRLAAFGPYPVLHGRRGPRRALRGRRERSERGPPEGPGPPVAARAGAALHGRRRAKRASLSRVVGLRLDGRRAGDRPRSDPPSTWSTRMATSRRSASSAWRTGSSTSSCSACRTPGFRRARAPSSAASSARLLMPTLLDVARRAGVSPMTVSRVVNGYGRVSPQAPCRASERALAETGYIPNTVARNLRTRRTDAIALVLPDMTNPFFTTLAHGVETAARSADISLLLANSDEREDEERRLVSLLLQRQVDGLLIVPAETGEATVRQCRDHGVPLVVVDRRPKVPGVDVVRADSERGAEELGRLLVSLGHRRIAVLSGPASRPDRGRPRRWLLPGARGRGGPAAAAGPARCLLHRERARHGAFRRAGVAASHGHLRRQQLHRHRGPARTRGARPPSPGRHGARGVRSTCHRRWSRSPSSRWLRSPRSRWVVAPSPCSWIASRTQPVPRVTSCCPRSSSSGARAAGPSPCLPSPDLGRGAATKDEWLAGTPGSGPFLASGPRPSRSPDW